VWNSTSPMSTNIGTGVSEKVMTDAIELRASWSTPATPPMNRNAPTTLAVRKASATGRPSCMKPMTPPSSSVRLKIQSMQNGSRENWWWRSCGGGGFLPHRLGAQPEPAHAEQKLDRHDEEQRAGRGQNPPFVQDED